MLFFYFTLYTLLFFLGAAIASFFAALIYRIEKEVPYPEIFLEGSSCEKCGKPLLWYELIPVISYFYFRGRCQKCGYKIPLSYPIWETAFGFTLLALLFYAVHWSIYLLVIMLFFLALYDFYHSGFPKQVMHLFLGVSVIVYLLLNIDTLTTERHLPLIIALIISLVVMILNQIKESFGEGDLLVLLMLSFFMNLEQLMGTIFLSLMAGGVVSVALLALGKVTRKSRIPFIPFYLLGTMLYFPLETFILRYFDNIRALWYIISRF